jgi:hypothetical protein
MKSSARFRGRRFKVEGYQVIKLDRDRVSAEIGGIDATGDRCNEGRILHLFLISWCGGVVSAIFDGDAGCGFMARMFAEFLGLGGNSGGRGEGVRVRDFPAIRKPLPLNELETIVLILCGNYAGIMREIAGK